MPPTFSEHLYTREIRNCPKCKQNTIHSVSVSWDKKEVYKRNFICCVCGHRVSEIISKELCTSIVPFIIFSQ